MVSMRPNSHHRQPGSGFESRGRTPLPALDGALACYVHLPTGARHLHLDLPAEDCAFLMAFLTPAPDSSGLTHVLEHLVMCGSERYPCRRAFFAMLGRTPEHDDERTDHRGLHRLPLRHAEPRRL